MKYLVAIILAFMPLFAFAQEAPLQPEIFEAKVVAVEEGQGTTVMAVEGARQGEEYFIQEFADLEVLSQIDYEVGDRVLIGSSPGPDGEELYITDHVRRGSLWWLLALFMAAVLIVGKRKGLRSLVILFLTGLIILKFIIPLILSGWSPVGVSIVGAVGILFLAIFGTEGFGKKSRLAFIAVLIALVVAAALSWMFMEAAKLTGIASDDALTLLSVAGGEINLRGLLLAGMIIGTLGVLDDVVISQVSVVKELASADRKLGARELFKRAMRVGTDHINAVVNTLFLAYAGVALPLLVLFSIDVPPFLSFGQVVNNEIVATEIVRTLVGSIALVTAVPIATWIAAREFQPKKRVAEERSEP